MKTEISKTNGIAKAQRKPSSCDNQQLKPKKHYSFMVILFIVPHIKWKNISFHVRRSKSSDLLSSNINSSIFENFFVWIPTQISFLKYEVWLFRTRNTQRLELAERNFSCSSNMENSCRIGQFLSKLQLSAISFLVLRRTRSRSCTTKKKMLHYVSLILEQACCSVSFIGLHHI